MHLRSGHPRAALLVASMLSSSLLAISLLAIVLLAGCSTRLPLQPAAATLSGKGGAEVAGINRKESVVVTLRSDADAATLAASYGATLVVNGWRIAGLKPKAGESADQLILELAGDPRVLTAEKNATVEAAEMRQKSWAFDDGWSSPETCEYQPAAAQCNLESAQHVSLGTGVLVAVLDTGAELGHSWLQGHLAGGWDFVSGDADPSESPDGIDNDYDGQVDEGWGHGTHVAGIVALAAPQARLQIVRVLDSEGRGDMLGVAQGIRWSIANGAKVINLSLGSSTSSDAVKLALDDASNAGLVVVAAAGNSGLKEGVDFPACYRQTIAVAAIDPNDKLASFSAYGSTIQLCAPGVSIRSSYRNAGYALWSGTSMASPWVSGGAALVLARNPGWTRGKVVDRLESTARPIWKQNPSLKIYLGSGALDLGAALASGING